MFIAATLVTGLLTIVPYGTYYLFFRAERDQQAMLIALVMFWIFGFWGVVAPRSRAAHSLWTRTQPTRCMRLGRICDDSGTLHRKSSRRSHPENWHGGTAPTRDVVFNPARLLGVA
jgi:hypothetical protein